MWNQIYNPLGNATLSTVAAAIPVVTLLVLIASGKVKAHIAALIALIVANIITIFIIHHACRRCRSGHRCSAWWSASFRSAGSSSTSSSFIASRSRPDDSNC